MRRGTRLAAVLAGTGVTIAACTVAAHVSTMQPRPVPASPGVRLPVPPAIPVVQLGIDIDAYTYPGQDVIAAARQAVAYIRTLHANAVSVSFPFYAAGPRSDRVVIGRGTPTPAQLGTVVEAAVRAGLYVSVRPLLDEASLGGAVRVRWVPPDPAAWFAAYRAFLLPYAAMAQRDHVAEFFTGAELTGFAELPLWARLDAAVARRFRGTLAYANNWGPFRFTGRAGPVAETVDAYQPMFPPLLAAWQRYDRRLPRGTVESEVGIAAVNGAWRRPWVHTWPVSQLEPAVQARWFTDACQAARTTHLGGIYFWAIGLGPPSGPTLTYQGSWAHSAGSAAIARCFAMMSR
jgi:hypothetical protein